MTWLIVGAGTEILLVEPAINAIDPLWFGGGTADVAVHAPPPPAAPGGADAAEGGDGGGPEQTALEIGLTGLMSVFIVHFLGSVLVAFTPHESLRPLAPLGLVFVVVALTMYEGSWAVKAALIGLAPLAGAPGVLWSAWRARRFDERFRQRIMQGRLGELTMELAYARRIHEALFPPPVVRGPVQIHYRYEPMREIGGDFLFVQPLSFPPAAEAAAMNVVLIDVSGHGVPAALAVNRLHGELTRFFAGSPSGSPGELLAALNAYASAALAPQAVYATALCMRFDAAAGTVAWANAGHPPAFLAGSQARRIALAPTAVMLGVVERDAFAPDEQSASMRAEDVLVAYTDGAVEALNGAGEPYSIERLKAAVERHGDVPDEPGRLAQHLMEEVKRFRRGHASDDILIVEVRMAAAETGSPVAPYAASGQR
jgi:serine phosphatase RsbU (regulator of sigma subunit)